MRPSLVLLSPGKFCDLPRAPVPEWHSHLDRKVTAGEFAEYLQRYSSEVSNSVKTGVEVASVGTTEHGFVVHLKGDPSPLSCRSVALCTGMVDFPKVPPPFTVPVLEALQFKDPDQVRGKKVLILGSGVTAVEVAQACVGSASEVWLSTKGGNVNTFPEKWLGINFHHWVTWLEKLPKSWFKQFCEGGHQEPVSDRGIRGMLKRGDIRLGRPSDPDLVISAIGYRFDSSLVPPEVARRPNGELLTQNCQSTSHPGLFVLGHRCSGGIDSAFLRGMRRDAGTVSELISRRSPS
jgi:thioredoxin reductase